MWQHCFMDFKRYTTDSEKIFCGSFFSFFLVSYILPLVFFVLFIYFLCYSLFYFLRLVYLSSFCSYFLPCFFSLILSSSSFSFPVYTFSSNMHKTRKPPRLTMRCSCIAQRNSNCHLRINVQAEKSNRFH